jgi:tetratricopeptide (TPR) repeat protein
MNSWGEHLRSATRGCLYTLVFLLPLLALSITLEPLEFNKQTLLLLLTSGAALCWLASMVIEKKLRFKRGLMNVLPLVWVGAFILPAMYSIAPYVSWVGTHSQQYVSVLTAGAVAVMMYLLANTSTTRAHHQNMHSVITLSATAVALTSTLMFSGISVFGSIGESLTFNSIGTLTSLGVFLTAVTSFLIASWVAHEKKDSLLSGGVWGEFQKLLILFLALDTFFLLLVIDNRGLWLLWVVAMLIPFVFAFFRAKDFSHQGRLLFPLALAVAALPFWFFLGSPLNISIPIEVTPDSESSMAIAEQTLSAHSSSYGSGPGTYALDYARFHDDRVNQTDFWNTRFDRASSHALTLVPTMGTLGAILLGLFTLLLFIRGIHQTLVKPGRDEWLESFVHLTPWVVLVISALLFPWNMTLTVFFGVFSGLLLSQTLPRSTNRSFAKSPALALLASVLLVALSLGLLVGVFVTTQRYVAQSAFAQAVELDRSGGELKDIVAALDKATSLNRFDDTYFRNLADALLLRTDEELEGVNGVDTLTPESAQYIQSLVAATVNAAARATDLSPENALNWLVRGRIYKELIPLMGTASEFSISSFVRAVELEPLNPSHWTELGIAYLAVAQHIQPMTAAEDKETATQALAAHTEFLASAQSAFVKATELKPNYAQAHYQLALAYQLQGRMDDAIGKMESVAAYNQIDVGVLFQLGLLYLQRGDTGDVASAQAALERTISLAPSYANAYWFLATVYEAQGDLSRAVQAVEAVLSLEPNNRLVQTRLDRLLQGNPTGLVPEALVE